MKHLKAKSTWLSLSISLKNAIHFLLIPYQRAKKEKTIKYRKILKFDSKIAENDVFISTIKFFDDSSLDKNNINIKDKAND